MTDLPTKRDANGPDGAPTFECPSCGCAHARSDYVRDQVLYRCKQCRVELNTAAVAQFLYAGEVDTPFESPSAPPPRSAAIPLFHRDGFMWVMAYFALSAFLIFVGAQGQRGLTQAHVFAFVAHVVAAGALLTRTRTGLYAAYAFLVGREGAGQYV